MTSNFSIIQQPNNTYILKYDMGTTCYQGLIDQNIFPEELKTNYIEVVNEAIKYFLKESEKETKIVSMLQHPNTVEVNYFMISFQRSDQFVKYQRFVNIELNKVVKTINDYLFEFDQRIVCNKNTIHDLSLKNESQEVEIKNLKETIDKLTERITKLEERPIVQLPPQQQPVLFNAGLPNNNSFQPTTPQFQQLPMPQQQLAQNHEKKDTPLFFPINKSIPSSLDLKNFNIQPTVQKKDLELTNNSSSLFSIKN